MENKREMARDETSVQPKPRKKKKSRETTKCYRPVHEGRRGPEATREKKKQEMKKRNETEMAEDRMEEARETKKRRTAAAEAVKAAMKGRRVRHRLLKIGADRGMNGADGEVWSDGEVSFFHGAQPREEAAEALDIGGRRERSRSGPRKQARRGKARRMDRKLGNDELFDELM